MASPDSLRQVITGLHAAIVDHSDPEAKAQMTQCLTILMKIQAKDHANAAQLGGAAQQVSQALNNSSRGY
jgi:hypothetical protein